MNRHPNVVTKPPITANSRVDFRRHNAIVMGDIRRPMAIDTEPINPVKCSDYVSGTRGRGCSNVLSFYVIHNEN